MSTAGNLSGFLLLVSSGEKSGLDLNKPEQPGFSGEYSWIHDKGLGSFSFSWNARISFFSLHLGISPPPSPLSLLEVSELSTWYAQIFHIFYPERTEQKIICSMWRWDFTGRFDPREQSKDSVSSMCAFCLVVRSISSLFVLMYVLAWALLGFSFWL